MSSLSYKQAPGKSGVDVLEHLLINRGTASGGIHYTLDCGGDDELCIGPNGILQGDAFIVDAYLFYRFDDGYDVAYVMYFGGKRAVAIITNRAFDIAQRMLSMGHTGEVRDFAKGVMEYREKNSYNFSFKFREFSDNLIGEIFPKRMA
ncbi:hypothetical protein [Hadaka virus 1]|nr:hypothetical protein [Hadaka virus 1]